MKIPKILIAEDNYAIARIYALLLKHQGFTNYSIVSDGQKVIDIYKESTVKPEVIIMDYRMPNKNGIQAAKEILRLDKKAKIIFATADESIKKKITHLSIFSILIKPFHNRDLIKHIKKALELE